MPEKKYILDDSELLVLKKKYEALEAKYKKKKEKDKVVLSARKAAGIKEA